jgi:L-asparaginase
MDLNPNSKPPLQLRAPYSDSSEVKPRLVIHGGAGRITHENLPDGAYVAYTTSLRDILLKTNPLIQDGSSAIDAACEAVRLLENDPLYNAGKGAVFTQAGTNELEASVMVSRGKRKRAVGVMLITRVKNPILLAKEILLRGEEDDGGGAGVHCQLSGKEVEVLAEKWGLEMVDPGYFYTKKRWEEHMRGLDPFGYTESTGSLVRVEEYLPQGTVGCVALDKYGTLCVATSTGGVTNKLPGRVGDTPTIGAGFWAEEWEQSERLTPTLHRQPIHHLHEFIPNGLKSLFVDCLPSVATSPKTPGSSSGNFFNSYISRTRSVAISGTGSGDSFLRISAARTVAAVARFSSPPRSLVSAVRQIIGPGGELQRSAGDRWGRTNEGQGGMIGIELLNGEGRIVMDLNCGGMFRGFIDLDGRPWVAVFMDDLH